MSIFKSIIGPYDNLVDIQKDEDSHHINYAQFEIIFLKKGSIYKDNRYDYAYVRFYDIDNHIMTTVENKELRWVVDKTDIELDRYDSAFTFLHTSDEEDDDGRSYSYFKVNNNVMMVNFIQDVGFRNLSENSYNMFEDDNDLDCLEDMEKIYFDFKHEYERVLNSKKVSRDYEIRFTDILAISITDSYCSYAGDGDVYYRYVGRTCVGQSGIFSSQENIDRDKKIRLEEEEYWQNV